MKQILMSMEVIALRLRDYGLPEYMAEGIFNYINLGITPGSFMHCLLANDLYGVFAAADDNNKLCLENWVRFLDDFLPPAAWGSWDAVDKWAKKRRDEVIL